MNIEALMSQYVASRFLGGAALAPPLFQTKLADALVASSVLANTAQQSDESDQEGRTAKEGGGEGGCGDELDKEDELNNEDETENDEEKLFTDKIEDLCQCTCSICNKRMTSKSLKEHIRKQHKMGAQEYINTYGEIRYSKLTYHRCKLCSKTLKAAVIVITNHVKKVHSLSFQQYRSMYNVFETSSSRTKIFIKNKPDNSDDRNSDDLVPPADVDPPAPPPLPPPPPPPIGGTPVLAGATTSADDVEPPQQEVRCQRRANFLRSFYFNHFLDNFEKLNRTLKRLSEQREEANKAAIFSQVNSQVSLSDSNAADESEKPSVEIRETTSTVASKAEAVFAFDDDDVAENDIGDGDNSDDDDEEWSKRSDPKTSSKRSDLKSAKRRKVRKEVKKEAKKVARVYTDSIEDLCESECQICGKRMTVKSLREHVRLRHEENIQDYRRKFGEFTYTKLTYHRCKLCRGVMKAAVISISQHVKQQHQMSFSQYKEIFNVFQSPHKKIRTASQSSSRSRLRTRMMRGSAAAAQSSGSLESPDREDMEAGHDAMD